MTNQKLKLSVNTHFLDKITKERRFYREGFENVELSLDEIAEVINLGCTISYQFRDGIRKSENFIGTDFLAVDIDYGMSLEQVTENKIFQNFCSIRHVTPSHTPDDHRFRLIFALPRTITKISEVKAAAISLTKRMSGDIKTTDAARMFHGCFESFPEVYDRGITEDFLQELIVDGKTQPSSESITFAGSTTNRSSLKFDPSLVVVTAKGEEVQIRNIKVTTPIYCPVHIERNPSAFVAHTTRGSQFIHCMSCNTSWHVKGTSEYEQRFNDFDHTIRKIKKGSKTETHDDSPLRDLMLSQKIHPKNITITEHEHLEMRGLEDGLTLIKSPKGTGKTTYLADSIGKIIRRFATLEDFEEGTDADAREAFFSKERVLLIGHRQALIGDLCNKLSLNCYLNDPKSDTSEVRRRMSRYGVCLDSLQKVKDESYDVIVIDEVEQVLSHFLSDTIGEKRRGLFDIFCRLIQRAKKVVALDADRACPEFCVNGADIKYRRCDLRTRW